MPRDGAHDRSAQQLRLRRFAMALATYGVVIIAVSLIDRIGLGAMSTLQWLAFLGLAGAINLVFYLVFRLDLNLRFREPSLTQAQIVASALWGVLPLYWLPAARPLILMFYMPTLSFGALRFSRRQYFVTVAWILALYATFLATERILGRPGFRLDYELLLFAIFALLLAWIAFFGGFVSELRRELRRQKDSIQVAHDQLSVEVAARARTAADNERLIVELQQSLAQVKKLSGLLPICASCKKIRDDRGYWNQIETYVRSHSEAEFTHGICPDCAGEFFPKISPAKPNPTA